VKGDPYTQSPMEPARAPTEPREELAERDDPEGRQDIDAGDDRDLLDVLDAGLPIGDPVNLAARLGSAEGGTSAFQLRIMQAQEAERNRLAQEIHDGPAQALSNAIFQVEYIERVIDSDTPLAKTELRYLRELLRRELGDVRAFISQLRPPLLDDLGLDGAIVDNAQHMQGLIGVPITTDLTAPNDQISDAQQTVVLRVAQEALQNIRKHAAATLVVVSTRLEGPDWVLEVRDDGRGFDMESVATRGRRNFGLQFMRERAELVGARFDVRSRPEGGTVVRLAIPTGPATGGEESS